MHDEYVSFINSLLMLKISIEEKKHDCSIITNLLITIFIGRQARDNLQNKGGPEGPVKHSKQAWGSEHWAVAGAIHPQSHTERWLISR